MKWTVEFLSEAEKDLASLDRSQQLVVLKAIDKVSENPLPRSEGGFGKPLGNHLTLKLAGCMKIKLVKQGLRVVYRIERTKTLMRIVVVSVRSDETVYRLAYHRIR